MSSVQFPTISIAIIAPIRSAQAIGVVAYPVTFCAMFLLQSGFDMLVWRTKPINGWCDETVK